MPVDSVIPGFGLPAGAEPTSGAVGRSGVFLPGVTRGCGPAVINLRIGRIWPLSSDCVAERVK